MTSKPLVEATLRDTIISKPDVILNDREVMHALIAANERAMGDNIIDLRGLAMDRLETRLKRLEETHNSVLAAAHEVLAGTNQIHRAVLRMLDPTEFEAFLDQLSSEVAIILRVDAVRLVLESTQCDDDPTIARMGHVLSVTKPGFAAHYAAAGLSVSRSVSLRQISFGDPDIYGDKADLIRSEACILLDLGDGRLPGLLALGSEDPLMFSPQQGTDLLAFFGSVFERAMRRWLS